MPMPSILVVEDDSAVRESTVDLFENLGLIVFQAGSGQQALCLLADHPEIQLLFSDVRMPGMNGTELAVEAQRRRSDLRIVLTSGYVGGVLIRGVDFIAKPYRPRDLMRAVVMKLEVGAPD